MQSYTHLSAQERECLLVRLGEGKKNTRSIAHELGRNVSSVSWALARNTRENSSYSPLAVTDLYRKRRKKCIRRRRLETDANLRAFVENRLNDFWSSQIVAARWWGKPVGHSTIYRALKARALPGYAEKSHLLRQGKRKYCRGDSVESHK